MPDFQFGDVKLSAPSFTTTGRMLLKGADRLEGVIYETVVFGTQHEIDRLTFHLPDYPDFMSKVVYREEVAAGKTLSWSEIVLVADEWTVRLQPYRDIHELSQQARATQQVTLSGVGELRKSDGAPFKPPKADSALQALRVFLSLAFGGWSPPLLQVGSNSVAERSCERWTTDSPPPRSHLRGWLDLHHGEHLADAFQGFMQVWARAHWQDPLELAVDWLSEASRNGRSAQGGIAFGQIPLEMLAWLVFAEDDAILEHKQFEKLSAASKIQLLLVHCGIPLAVPAELPALCAVAAQMQAKGNKTKLVTGAQLVTKVRNSIVHPNKKNRSLLADWKKDYSVTGRDIRWETLQLFRWYVTLVLLQLTGYTGEYANRLSPRRLGQVEAVPWA
ncbi:MAG: hypothetical protein U0836_24010 [Pirellulales bacterium]